MKDAIELGYALSVAFNVVASYGFAYWLGRLHQLKKSTQELEELNERARKHRKPTPPAPPPKK